MMKVNFDSILEYNQQTKRHFSSLRNQRIFRDIFPCLMKVKNKPKLLVQKLTKILFVARESNP